MLTIVIDTTISLIIRTFFYYDNFHRTKTSPLKKQWNQHM